MYPAYYTAFQLLRTAIVARSIGLGEFSHNVTNLEINGGQVLANERGIGNFNVVANIANTDLVGMGRTGGGQSTLEPECG